MTTQQQRLKSAFWMPRIQCAICNKPVREIEWHEAYWEHKLYITVRCHGDKDTMVLTDEDRMRLKKMPSDGTAFETKRIAGEPQPPAEPPLIA